MRAGLVGTPTHELVLGAVDSLLRLRSLGSNDLRHAIFYLKRRNRILLVKASRARRLNPERRRHNLLNFNFNFAVEMVATAVVVGNFIRMQNNSLDVIFGNRDAQIILYLFFIVVENLTPIGVGARQCPSSASGAIGPTYDTIRDVVPRVYAAKGSSVNIHFDIEVAASASREPIARGIRIGIIRRALQEKELCVFLLGGRLRYRDVMRCCKHFALGGNGGRRNSNFSFSNTSHFAARVNSSDGRIARRPCNIRCIRSELRSFKLIDRAGARNSEARNGII